MKKKEMGGSNAEGTNEDKEGRVEGGGRKQT